MAHSRRMRKDVVRYIKVLDDYFTKREMDGLSVPESSRTKGKFSFNAIANGTGIPRVTLMGSPDLIKHMKDWVLKIGFGPVGCGDLESPRRPGKSPVIGKLVDSYIEGLKKEGKKLPENPRYSGRPDWERISSESSIPVNSLRSDSLAGKRLLAAAKELGIELYPVIEDWHAITYGELLRKGCEWRSEELKDKSKAAQQLYNTKSHLRYFMRHTRGEGAALEEQDPVGVELLEKATETIKAVTDNIKNANTRRTFTKEMKRWTLYFLRLCRSKDLPPEFASALSAAIERAGMSPSHVAEESGVNYSAILYWICRYGSPSIESFPGIRRIENTLSLPPDSLTSRVLKSRQKHFPANTIPDHVVIDGEKIELKRTSKTYAELRSLLPDWYDERPIEERIEIATWLVKNLIMPCSEWGLWHRANTASPYALNKLPPSLKREWEGLTSFKCGKLAPPGMKRQGSWSKATVDIRKSIFTRFWGYLVIPQDEDDPRFRGLGIEPEFLSLAMLVRYDFVDGWIRWIARRRKGGILNESYSFNDLMFLEMVINLLSPVYGWLRQRPELADNLKPVPGFIDDEFIESAKRDWNGVCNEALASYEELATALEDVAEEQRDPFDPILPLLDPDHIHYQNPIRALRTFSQNIINDLPNPTLAPVKAARHVRNYLITRILPETALRSRNLRELTYRDDNTGQIRRKGDKWVIVIPWQAFKNKHSSFFGTKKKRHDYVKELADQDDLYKWLEEYVTIHRPLLLKGRKSDILFINSGRDDVFASTAFHNIYRRMTMIYFAYNPYLERGVPGVRPHGPHAVRDILATFVIQQTGSYELAAYVIGDSAATVREHYTRFTPKNKTRLVDFLIRAAWNNEDVDQPPSLISFAQELLGNARLA